MIAKLADRLDDDGDDSSEPIPLTDRSCHSRILAKVIEYLAKHIEFDAASAPAHQRDEWDRHFLQVPPPPPGTAPPPPARARRAHDGGAGG